jgi:hypothetical protein
MGLDGPSREIRVEPVTLPAPAREDAPSEAPAEPVERPVEEPVPA